MSKKPSAETELRTVRREVREARDQIRRLDAERGVMRGQITKAQQDAAEWKRRFDALLERVPVRAIESAEGSVSTRKDLP